MYVCTGTFIAYPKHLMIYLLINKLFIIAENYQNTQIVTSVDEYFCNTNFEINAFQVKRCFFFV